jgi:AraC family transcriptional regulator, regulatory protein of adaptative response / methylphosphotriester-DNA alkyltransferase methyltransferase
MTDRSRRGMRPQTVAQRRRLYLQARLAIKRHYARPLTLQVAARALTTSPRQIQRAYAQFGDGSFHDDLVGRRMEAAAELLRLPLVAVRDVARQVGYRQPSHFARVPVPLRRATYGIPLRTAPAKAQRDAWRDRRMRLTLTTPLCGLRSSASLIAQIE